MDCKIYIRILKKIKNNIKELEKEKNMIKSNAIFEPSESNLIKLGAMLHEIDYYKQILDKIELLYMNDINEMKVFNNQLRKIYNA